MPAPHSYIRTNIVAVAAGAALIAAVLIAGGLAAALIGHVSVPAVLRGDDHGTVSLADAQRAPRSSLSGHGPVAGPRAVAAQRIAPTVAIASTRRPVLAQREAKGRHKTHRPRTRTRTSPAPVGTPAPVIASTPPARAPARPTPPPGSTRHDNGRHLGQTRTTAHDNGRHVGQTRKSSPPAAPSTPATRPHGNPHGGPTEAASVAGRRTRRGCLHAGPRARRRGRPRPRRRGRPRPLVARVPRGRTPTRPAIAPARNGGARGPCDRHGAAHDDRRDRGERRAGRGGDRRHVAFTVKRIKQD
jgi:hypothetical protein